MNKKLGMLLGLHVGDCMGVTLEFQPPVLDKNQWQTDLIGGGEFNFPVGVGSDDSDLMICVLRSLKYGKLDEENLKNEFIKWFESGPKDVGNTTKKAMKKLSDGESIQTSGVNDEGTNTNGSLMRCAPMALISNLVTLSELSEAVRRQTASTHAHPECVQMDWVLIVLLSKILNQSLTKDELFEIALEEVSSFSFDLGIQFKKLKEEKWEDVTNGGRAFETLKSAFWSFYHFDNYREGIIAIINRGNDSDTTAAVAGALFGAYYGEKSIPKEWVEKVNYKNEIEDLLKLIEG